MSGDGGGCSVEEMGGGESGYFEFKRKEEESWMRWQRGVVTVREEWCGETEEGSYSHTVTFKKWRERSER